MNANRRDVLRGIGTGTALLAGASGVASADFFDDKEGDKGDDDREKAEVRVLHASPDAPAVDVFLDGNAVIEGITFKTITDYLPVPAGTYNVKVAPAGAGAGNAVIDTDLTVEADTDYTVAAINKLANIAPTVFVDDNDVGFETDARVRVAHLSPDAPDVDVAQTDGFGVVFEPEIVVDGLSYRNATGYLELLPTDYAYEIRPAGREEGVLDFDVDLDAGATYTVFAVGLLNPGSESEAFDVVVSLDVPPLSERAADEALAGIDH